MTTAMETPDGTGRIGVNVGYAEGITCPVCRETHDVKYRYFCVTVDGVSICEECLDRLTDDDPKFRYFAELAEKLDELDTAMFTSWEDGKTDPLLMANLCALIQVAVRHIADRWTPKAPDDRKEAQ